MRRRLVGAVLIVCGAVFCVSDSAAFGADRWSGGEVRDSTPEVSVSNDEVPSPAQHQSPLVVVDHPPPDCVWKVVDPSQLAVPPDQAGQIRQDVTGQVQISTDPPTPGHWEKKICASLVNMDPMTRAAFEPERFIPNGPPAPAPVVSPRAVAQQAVAQLPLPVPALQMDPVPAKIHTVNVPMFLWVSQPWTELTATAAVNGVSATVRATPVSVTWDMGDGHNLICNGPGTPSDPNVDLRKQSTDCEYTYRRSSAGQPDDSYTIKATVNYSVSWTSTGVAGGGDLGYVSKVTSFSTQVGEIEAINILPEP